MFIGHYGVAYAAKTVAPKVPLAAYFLAVQALDVLFSVFVLSGIEHMEIVHKYTSYNPYRLYDMPITHSLVGSLGWAVAVGFVAAILRLPRRESLWLGLAVFSHFILDLLVHTLTCRSRATTPQSSVWACGTASLSCSCSNC